MNQRVDYDCIIEVVRKKIDPGICSKKSKFICHLDGKTQELFSLKTGMRLIIPWNPEISVITLIVFIVDGVLTRYIGHCNITEMSNNTRRYSKIIGNSGECVGCLYFVLNIEKRYAEKGDHAQRISSKQHQYDESKMHHILPSFRFRKLGRRINWDRLRSLNVERYEQDLLICYNV